MGQSIQLDSNNTNSINMLSNEVSGCLRVYLMITGIYIPSFPGLGNVQLFMYSYDNEPNND